MAVSDKKTDKKAVAAMLLDNFYILCFIITFISFISGVLNCFVLIVKHFVTFSGRYTNKPNIL